MRLTEAHRRLLKLPESFFTTNEAAAILGVEGTHATKILSRLAETEHVVRLVRGRWAFPERAHSMALPEALTSPTPSYVSLFSALYHHSIIEQIPTMIYAMTLGPTRRIRTPIGTVSLHQVVPSFFFGFETTRLGAKLAVPEKALLDVLYLYPAKSRKFRALPELHLPSTFSRREAREMVKAIESPQRRALVADRLESILERASRSEL
jgi:predicted transcriptional regulator of viral defense system